MLGAVHHLGYFVVDLEESIKRYEVLFGAHVERRITNPFTGNPAAFIRTGDGILELMESTDPNLPPGMLEFDHAAYLVDDLDGMVARLKSAGVTFEQDAPVPNNNRRSIWISADAITGVRMQLIGD